MFGIGVSKKNLLKATKVGLLELFVFLNYLGKTASGHYDRIQVIFKTFLQILLFLKNRSRFTIAQGVYNFGQ